MKLNQPIAFLATDNPAAAREFYESTLGLEFVSDEPVALVFQTGTVSLRIQKLELQLAANLLFAPPGRNPVGVQRSQIGLNNLRQLREIANFR